MRAYAFGNDRLLDDVAKDVVARQMRFDDQIKMTDVGQLMNNNIASTSGAECRIDRAALPRTR